MLPGWEGTSLMESEPELVAQLLDHRIAELPQRVITLGYHPYLAHRASFRPGGSVQWFAEVLDLLATRGCQVMTLRDVYRAVDAAQMGKGRGCLA